MMKLAGYVSHVMEMGNTKFLAENIEEENAVGDLKIDWKVIIKLMLKSIL